MNSGAKLIWLCGKMAAGKSTLARDLAEREDAILLVQDEFLETLWPGEITDVPEFIDRSRRLRKALAPHISRSSVERHVRRTRLPRQDQGATCVVPRIIRARLCRTRGALCRCVRRPLQASTQKDRSRNLPPGTPWTTDTDFEAITVYFQAPTEEEGFNVVRHPRA